MLFDLTDHGCPRKQSEKKKTSTCFRKKTKSSIAISFRQQLLSCYEVSNILFHRLSLICFILNLISSYAHEDVCQISNQSKFCQSEGFIYYPDFSVLDVIFS